MSALLQIGSTIELLHVNSVSFEIIAINNEFDFIDVEVITNSGLTTFRDIYGMKICEVGIHVLASMNRLELDDLFATWCIPIKAGFKFKIAKRTFSNFFRITKCLSIYDRLANMLADSNDETKEKKEI